MDIASFTYKEKSEGGDTELLKDSGITDGDLEKGWGNLPENRGPQESMFFGLDANRSTEESEEPQMWFTESSSLMDWLFEDEDMQCH